MENKPIHQLTSRQLLALQIDREIARSGRPRSEVAKQLKQERIDTYMRLTGCTDFQARVYWANRDKEN